MHKSPKKLDKLQQIQFFFVILDSLQSNFTQLSIGHNGVPFCFLQVTKSQPEQLLFIS